MISIIKQNRTFLIGYALVLVLAIVLLCNYSKADLHIWSNQHSSIFLDHIAWVVTFFGDGLFVIIIGMLLLLQNIRNTIFVLSTWAVSGLVVQLLKKLVFSDVMRPKTYFYGVYDLHFVEGVKILSKQSFPSGHSAAGFALFLCLAIITRNQWVKAGCLLVAILVAYTRVYLSQHFLIDITVGSFIGVLIVLLYKRYLYDKISEKYNKPVYKINSQQ